MLHQHEILEVAGFWEARCSCGWRDPCLYERREGAAGAFYLHRAFQGHARSIEAKRSEVR